MRQPLCTPDMRFLKLNPIGVLFVSLALLLAGCSKKASADTDAIGYQCQKCKAKFYTDTDVWAEFCPACKASGPPRAAGFLCLKDNYLTIPQAGEPPQPDGKVKCGKCGVPTDVMRDPRALELQTWGATKKTRKDVCAN